MIHRNEEFGTTYPAIICIQLERRRSIQRRIRCLARKRQAQDVRPTW